MIFVDWSKRKITRPVMMLIREYKYYFDSVNAFPVFFTKNDEKNCRQELLQTLKGQASFRRIQVIRIYIESVFNRKTNKIEQKVVTRSWQEIVDFGPFNAYHSLGINAADCIWPYLNEPYFGVTGFRVSSLNVGLRKITNKCHLILECVHECFSGKAPVNTMKITFPNLKKFFNRINPGNLAKFPFRIVFILYMRLWAKEVFQRDRRFINAASGQVDNEGIDRYIMEILRSTGIPHHEIDITLAPRNKFLYYLTTCRTIYIGYFYHHPFRHYRKLPFYDMFFFGNTDALREHIRELEKVALSRNYDLFMPFFIEVEQKEEPKVVVFDYTVKGAKDANVAFDPLVEIEKYDLSLSSPSASAVAKRLYEYKFFADD
ncbi:Oidioi.mRNA.OKI2018_I69.chr2.g7962.t1.cds [Oikopleura dioica]|uniref:Oidioi.mRNA.OKI2018_I69.chr2.g7962.t1.cds n=1 Tax=Oikopleura dioica TaxID=34765 RepID=A0ABN7TEF2_OIKDI|nr:Oidioi.mRNA.OKI2018_I69.chr2.g7962.t1.cds [Oikopleura dioica]